MTTKFEYYIKVDNRKCVWHNSRVELIYISTINNFQSL